MTECVERDMTSEKLLSEILSKNSEDYASLKKRINDPVRRKLFLKSLSKLNSRLVVSRRSKRSFPLHFEP